jgi:hypothetical protein
MRKKTDWRVVIILGISLLVLIGFIGASAINKKPAIPKQLVGAAVGFRLYYPKQLPTRLQVMNNSIRVNDQAVIFQVQDTSGKRASITEQHKPPNFDFDSLSAGKKFTTANGEAIINTNDNITTASLVTDSTWILIRSDSGFPTQSVEDVVNALSSL